LATKGPQHHPCQWQFRKDLLLAVVEGQRSSEMFLLLANKKVVAWLQQKILGIIPVNG